jgi:hypothetical protein
VLFGFKPRLQARNLGLAGPGWIVLIEPPSTAVPKKVVGEWRLRWTDAINTSGRYSPMGYIPANMTSLQESSKHTGLSNLNCSSNAWRLLSDGGSGTPSRG